MAFQQLPENLYSDPFREPKGTNLEQRIKMRKLILAVMELELTERQREVLQMYYIDNMKMPEIAQNLNMSKNNVKKHLHAALKKVKKIKNIFDKVAY